MITTKQLDELFQKKIEIYNKTDLSQIHGWVYNYSFFGYSELKTIFKYFQRNMSCLDVGTGRAIVPRVLSDFSNNIYSIDSKGVSGNLALDNLKDTNITTANCNLENDQLPFEDNSFDFIFFGDVIEHLIHSPKNAILEFKRVLKPNGIIISTTPNAIRLTVRIRVLLGYSNWANIKEYYHSIKHFSHHHEYTADEFKWVFEEAGFKYVDLIMIEENLRYEKMAGLKDIQTQDRKLGLGRKETVFGLLIKKILLLVTDLFPKLRGNMILVMKNNK